MKKILLTLCGVMLIASAAFAQEIVIPNSDMNIFTLGYIQVVGESDSNQSRYYAKKAARMDAQVKLLEAAKGVALRQVSNKEGGRITADLTQSATEGVLRGAYAVTEEYFNEEGFARVVMRLNLHGSNSLSEYISPIIHENFLKSAKKIPAFTPETTLTSLPVKSDKKTLPPVTSVEETPATSTTAKKKIVPAASPEFDGIIVIVKSDKFKPSMSPCILTEKRELLFGIDKIAQHWMITRGCGYTNDEAKAKAILSERGSSSPLIVNSIEVLDDSRIILSQEDSTVIFAQDQKNNIFSEAKIVFVCNS